MSHTVAHIPPRPRPDDGLRQRAAPPPQSSATVPQPEPLGQVTAAMQNSPLPITGHQRFVFTDHVAFRYLEEDPSVTVLARRQRLEGYEIYIVEQWACSREHPTFIITTFTGDPKDSVVANVMSVPTDDSEWSPELRMYFKSLSQYHARKKETNLGTLFITNLSGFPSSLTVIPVPEGDIKKHRESFFVNENLKRLGCSGRLGISLSPPTASTKAKFYQLYRASDKVPFDDAVIELVKLCQVALVLFGRLQPQYADGLLCDMTEKAINDWWLEFGAEYYAIEPHDGILGPTTVAALLGMLMGARNRLSAYNAPVAKDVFDIESTKRGIAYFQKSQHLHKTRRLDRVTLERLRRVTAKAASGEDWTLPRALRSTVAELGGKGGEMVMGMVGARDKARIADIETVDIDRFVELVQGERSKWLWHGKPRKTTAGTMFSRLPSEENPASGRDQGDFSNRLERKATVESASGSRRGGTDEVSEHEAVMDGLEKEEKDPFSKRAVLKRATGKIEAGSGLGRIKDVVGRRSHQQKSSKDELDNEPVMRATHAKATHSLFSPGQTHAAQAPESMTDSSLSVSRGKSSQGNEGFEATFAQNLTYTPLETQAKSPEIQWEPQIQTGDTIEQDTDGALSNAPTVEGSVAGSTYQEIELPNVLSTENMEEIGPLLRRTQSLDRIEAYGPARRNDNRWPRHLSFSIAEESVLTWRGLLAADRDSDSLPPNQQLAQEVALSAEAKRLRGYLSILRSMDATWAEQQIAEVQNLNNQADLDLQELDDMYYQRLEDYHGLREDAHELLSRERSQVMEAVRDIETLGAKLDYEINTLRGKVEDVEDGVNELERQVAFVEERVAELEDVVVEREGWVHWILRISTGIGKPPALMPG